MKLTALALAALAPLATLGSGCIYAPLDLGLGELGKIQEVTVAGDPEESRKIVLVRVDGEIDDHGESGGLFGGSEGTTAQVKEQLEIAAKDERVKGVILRINSPGGGVTASDIIYRELLKFRRETSKPIVALMMDVAASGGYYIAQASDAIVAHPTCVTGSIGVISLVPNVNGLLLKIGVGMETFKKGAKKDVGNPFRTMTDDDRAVFQGLLDKMYEQFVTVVVEGRKGKVSAAAVRQTEARVYTAPEAKALKLIDEVGYFDDALDLARKLAGAKEAKVVAYERKGFGSGRRTIYSRSFADPVAAELFARGAEGDRNVLKVDARPLLQEGTGPAFKYLWAPAIE